MSIHKWRVTNSTHAAAHSLVPPGLDDGRFADDAGESYSFSGAGREAADLDAFDTRKTTLALPNGEKLAYIDMGNPSGAPVVLIHRYTDNAQDWLPMLPYLSEGLRLILVDIRGHGKSSKPECCHSRLDFACDIKLLLAGIGVKKADIIGHSLGSIIAQTFAETARVGNREAIRLGFCFEERVRTMRLSRFGRDLPRDSSYRYTARSAGGPVSHSSHNSTESSHRPRRRPCAWATCQKFLRSTTGNSRRSNAEHPSASPSWSHST